MPGRLPSFFSWQLVLCDCCAPPHEPGAVSSSKCTFCARPTLAALFAAALPAAASQAHRVISSSLSTSLPAAPIAGYALPAGLTASCHRLPACSHVHHRLPSPAQAAHDEAHLHPDQCQPWRPRGWVAGAGIYCRSLSRHRGHGQPRHCPRLHMGGKGHAGRHAHRAATADVWPPLLTPCADTNALIVALEQNTIGAVGMDV